jgi:hypothetical protein
MQSAKRPGFAPLSAVSKPVMRPVVPVAAMAEEKQVSVEGCVCARARSGGAGRATSLSFLPFVAVERSPAPAAARAPAQAAPARAPSCFPRARVAYRGRDWLA